MRVYCKQCTRKGGITTVDLYGRSQFRKAKQDGVDRNIHACAYYGPDNDKGWEECFDPERMWCLKNNCSVFECNQLWWRKKCKQLHKNLERLDSAVPGILECLEKYKNLNPESLTDLTDFDTYCFYRDLRNAFKHWRPEVPEKFDLMKIFYEQRFGNEED